MGISVVINTYNAEKYLEAVLESVKTFDEVVICDMHSNDRTLEIAKKYRCKIVFHEQTGIVEPARNFAIQSASNEWVLLIDADEIVPDALKLFLYDWINAPHSMAVAIRIPRKNFFMGRFMHADYPNYLVRFFKKDVVEWPSYVHAHPVISGEIYTIQRKHKKLAFIHLANDSVKQTIAKFNTYSDRELERRKNRHYSLLLYMGEVCYRFFKFYILKGGFRDGRAGLAYSSIMACYKILTILKVWESHLQTEDYDEELKKYIS